MSQSPTLVNIDLALSYFIRSETEVLQLSQNCLLWCLAKQVLAWVLSRLIKCPFSPVLTI